VKKIISKSHNLKPDTLIVRDNSQVFSVIDGEVVMLSIKKGEYYNLNNVGSDIWCFLEKPIKFEHLLLKLTDLYDVTEETCKKDITPYLQDFIESKLILILDE